MNKQSTKKSQQLVDQTYMEALNELRQLIEKEYTDGGWLPSGRIMCAKLNVNRITYAKALSRLIDEGLAKNYPRKGTFIKPDALRIKKVGVIFGNGEDCPYLGMSELLVHIIQELKKYDISVQLIQANQPENLLKKAMFHCVNSLIWIYSHSSALQVAEKIHESGLMPILAVRRFDPKKDEDIASGTTPLISQDYQMIGAKRAERLLADGHHRIAFTGSQWFAEYIGFGNSLRKAGIPFDERFCFPDCKDILSRLATFIKQEKITAVFSEGDFMENTFQVVSELPLKLQPELYVRHLKEDIFKAMYPNMKPIKVEHVTMGMLGTRVTEEITRLLLDGIQLTSQTVPPQYEISTL